MASSFEKSVKGATKIKLAAPKSKYVEHILVATHAGEQGVAEVFRVLQNRLRDSTWTIVFKSLIIVHFMIREGEPDVTLRHLSSNPTRKLAINNFTEVQTQGRNIKAYAEYLVQRVNSFSATKVDFVRAGEGRLTRLSVEKGLLRETESVQSMIRALLRCDFLTLETENDISLTAFRLLVMDLLVLFHVMNEGMVNILQHFFEMSKPDAERTLNIYRTFVKQTENVVKYLSVARNYEHVTRLEIPTLKHAPTVLTTQLEEYVKDPDFEVMRRQYLAQQGAKKGGKTSTNGSSKLLEQKTNASATKSEAFPEPKVGAQSETKAPKADLIDFFESIEQNQTTMNTNPFQQPQLAQAQNMPAQATGFQQSPFGIQQTGVAGSQAAFTQQQTGFSNQQTPFGVTQPTGFQQPSFGPQQSNISNQQNTAFGIQTTGMTTPQQQTFSPAQASSAGNPFAQAPSTAGQQPLQPSFTGAGFGGYTPQPQNQRFTPALSSIPQNSAPSFTPSVPATEPPASTNPFRQSMLPQSTGNPFAKQQSPPVGTQNTLAPPNNNVFSPSAPMMPQATGTNPFARPQTGSPGPALGGVTTHATGSTNPFRQSQFVNQSTGLGWQSSVPQGTIGGLSPDQIQTTSIFPRPGAGQ
ncbi:uncharacterized protein PV09_02232 [Verruconis gallopava]|uniref:ENTH domain-containing protein n=1 Tax=Verruconis gallopava TaxID=253628 RepID=A0A0D2B835_9PEZI|nr:uncharacterized protein PV09_02232 [Verruconis gallopava]KIW07389.1 hypothetical protein PV09_02232 [Verruconis gallopava]